MTTQPEELPAPNHLEYSQPANAPLDDGTVEAVAPVMMENDEVEGTDPVVDQTSAEIIDELAATGVLEEAAAAGIADSNADEADTGTSGPARSLSFEEKGGQEGPIAQSREVA